MLRRIMHRRALFTGGMATALLGGCTQGPEDLDAPEPPWPVARDYPQRFHTQGHQLLDEAGQPRILRGLAVPDVLWLAQRGSDGVGYFDRALFRAAAEWRADVLRLSVAPAVWRHHGDAALLRALDDSVAYARRYGLYLIICFHGIGFPPDGRSFAQPDWFYGELLAAETAEIQRFWQLVARRYARQPAVAAYELFNEPARLHPDGSAAADDGPEDWLRWRDWAEALVDTVRGQDPHKPVVLAGLQFGYNLHWALASGLACGRAV